LRRLQRMRNNMLSHFECSVCGEEFQKPLRASVTSGFKVSEYYACPNCLSQVDSDEELVDDQETQNGIVLSEERVQESVSNASEQSRGGTFEVKAECEYELGYLKRRPRNTSVPDQCLICTKMIECMTS
jgi:DNA-directed RNA polymerase subunit RPC12/RpoP